MNKTRVTLDEEVIDLIDDALSYYHLAEMGGGARNNAKGHRALIKAMRAIDNARKKVEKNY